MADGVKEDMNEALERLGEAVMRFIIKIADVSTQIYNGLSNAFEKIFDEDED